MKTQALEKTSDLRQAVPAFPTLALATAALFMLNSTAAPIPETRLKAEIAPEQMDAVAGPASRLIADYGSFQLWDIPVEIRQNVERVGGRVHEGEDVIRLNTGPIRTAPGMAQQSAAAKAAFIGKRLHLVQFAGPIKPEWRQMLVDEGWRIVAYVPQNAYLVCGRAETLGRLRTAASAAPHIQWEGEYKSEFKTHPAVWERARKADTGGHANDLFAVQLIEDPELNAATLQWLEQHQQGFFSKTTNSVLGYVNCILRLPAGQLNALADQPDVVSIQPYEMPTLCDERQSQIVAGNLSGYVPSGPGYLAWLSSKGFTQAQFDASGFVVDVSDSGIDNGTTTPGHFGLYTQGNKSLASRVVYNRIIGDSIYAVLEGCDGHGNLNAHIIAGYNDLSGFPHTDSGGYRYGLGVCPFVRVGSSVITARGMLINPDYTEVQSRAYQDGARISCNSWGTPGGHPYGVLSQTYDALVRDAQPATPDCPYPAAGNQQMVIVFAAGNEGQYSVREPGNAKNVLCVGASENVRSLSIANGGDTDEGMDGSGWSDMEADSANDLAPFSSTGPCQDGRVKPDLVAPGTHVTGGVAQESMPGPVGDAISCFDGSVISKLTGSIFFPLSQEFYSTSSGTSQACPAVCGGAALLRQYFINHGWTAPSPAMTKAWLMNSCRYMSGDGVADDTLPSYQQGMGAMNLGTAFDDTPRFFRDQEDNDRFTATGQSRIYELFIADPTKPTKVTLAWTDAPGNTLSDAFNNDLDLRVTVGGATYLGNVFTNSFSILGGRPAIYGGGPDLCDNVESVFLPAGLSGLITVTVVAANINSDGVPNNSDPQDQDFALVAYNVTTSGAPASCMAAPSGLVSLWRAEGDAHDAAGSNDGAPYNPIQFGGGEAGYGFLFNGVDQNVVIPASSSLDVGAGDGLTFEAWINPWNLDQQTLAEWNDFNNHVGVHFWLSANGNSGSLYANLVDNAGGDHSIQSTAGLVKIGRFQHMALTYNKTIGVARLYLNGQQVGWGGFGSLRPQTSYSLILGASAGGNYFKGVMDEASLYNRELTQSQIQAIYEAGSGGKCPDCVPTPPGLVSWWPGEGNAKDLASGGNYGALVNNPIFASGQVGQGFRLNGLNSYVKIGPSPSMDVGAGAGMTFEAWIKPLNLSRQPVAEWNDYNNYFGHLGTRLYISESASDPPGCLYANLVDSAGVSHVISTSAGVITPNTFQHVALTYDKASGVAKLYVNGTVVQSLTLGSFTPQTSYDLYLGGHLPDGYFSIGTYFNGVIDEVCLYNRALASYEIQSIVSVDLAGHGKCPDVVFPPTCAALGSGSVSWWKAEGNADDFLSANNGQANAITYTSGEVNQAFGFDGVNSFIKIPASASLDVGTGTGMTFETWIKPANLSRQALAQWCTDAGGLGTHLFISEGPYGSGAAGCVYANIVDTGGVSHIMYSIGGLAVANTWQHVALTYDKSTGWPRYT